MRAAHPGRILIVLACLWAGLALLSGWRGGMYFLSFETDMAHLVQILLRLEAGQQVHVDFSTPLGAWGFWPIQALMATGLGMGKAMVWSQALVALLVLPGLWWAAASRLPRAIAIAFGAAVLVIIMALTHGDTNSSVTFAMHYNRWCWAILMPALVVALLPFRTNGRALLIDGVVVGTSMVALAMIKASFFVAFAPAVILGLILQRSLRGLGLALGIGAVAIGVLTLVHGMSFWQAYMDDLLAVAASDLRTAPGDSLSELVGSPRHVMSTLVLIAAVLVLRRAQADGAALLLIVMAPGAYYATFQNYANDPIWLIVVALVVLAAADSARLSQRRAIAVAAAVIVLPVMINFTLSLARHAFQPPGGFRPLMAAPARHSDVQIATARTRDMIFTMKDSPTAAPDMFQGRPLPACELSGGFVAHAEAVIKELSAQGITRQPFVADLFMPHWMLAGWAALDGGQPWYYGGLPGIEAAEHVLVPDCPVSTKARETVLQALEDRGLTFETPTRGGRFSLFRIVR